MTLVKGAILRKRKIHVQNPEMLLLNFLEIAGTMQRLLTKILRDHASSA